MDLAFEEQALALSQHSQSEQRHQQQQQQAAEARRAQRAKDSSSGSGSGSGSETEAASSSSSKRRGRAVSDSLRRMIDSEMFPLHLAVQYLHEQRDAVVQQLLCQRLRLYSIDALEFYLPQLLTLFVHDPLLYAPLQQLLLELSAANIHIALLTTWLLTAELSSLTLLESKHKAAERLLHDIRAAKLLTSPAKHASASAASRRLSTTSSLDVEQGSTLDGPIGARSVVRRSSTGSLQHATLVESDAEAEAIALPTLDVDSAPATTSSSSASSASQPTPAASADGALVMEGDRTPTPGSPEAALMRRPTATDEPVPEPPPSPGLQFGVSSAVQQRLTGHRRTKSDAASVPLYGRTPSGISPTRRAAMLQQLNQLASSFSVGTVTANEESASSSGSGGEGTSGSSPASGAVFGANGQLHLHLQQLHLEQQQQHLRDALPAAATTTTTTTSSSAAASLPLTVSGSLSSAAMAAALASLDPRAFGSLKSSPTSSTSSLLDSGHAFEWPVPRATSSNALDDFDEHMACSPDRGTNVSLGHYMAAQNTFINVLMEIGERLRRYPTRDIRRTQLYGELALLNLNLPARVYVPLGVTEDSLESAEEGSVTVTAFASGARPSKRMAKVYSHHVVRIPPQEALTLNSKDKAPYMLQVEVVDCEDFLASPVPPKLTVASAKSGQRGHKRSVSEGRTHSPADADVDDLGPDSAFATDQVPMLSQSTDAVLVPKAEQQQQQQQQGGGSRSSTSSSKLTTPLPLSTSLDVATATAEPASPSTAATTESATPVGSPTAENKSQPPTPRSASFAARWFGWFRSRSSSSSGSKDVKDVRVPKDKLASAETVAPVPESPSASPLETTRMLPSPLNHSGGVDGASDTDDGGLTPVASPGASSGAAAAASGPATVTKPTTKSVVVEQVMVDAVVVQDRRAAAAPLAFPVLPASQRRALEEQAQASTERLNGHHCFQKRDSSDQEEDQEQEQEEEGHEQETTPLASTRASINAEPNTAAAADDDASTSSMSVKEIRLRLSQASNTPEIQFQRNHTDPAAVRAKEPWASKVARIRRTSPYGHLRSWRLVSVIVKTGDDLRQELLASQLLSLFQQVWREERMELWLRPIRILVTSAQGGLIEVVGGAVSLHQTKKQTGDTLPQYFVQQFGQPNTEGFLKAQRNFVESLAAYSLFCHFAQVKDRHNGNILIDNAGHILHIDFGFFFSNSPGHNLGFETAPFKLLDEFIQVMGGRDSDMFKYFEVLVLKGFLAARKHVERFVTLVSVAAKDASLPCFVGGAEALAAFRERFKVGLSDAKLEAHVKQLVHKSLGNTRTKLYDNYQYYTNGIL